MRFHRLKDVSHSPSDLVCRQSRWILALVTLIGLAFTAVPFFIVDHWLKYAWAMLIAIFPLLFGAMFFRSLGPQNWLLIVNGRGELLIKFRSFANAHFDEHDEVVLLLEPRDIVWLRQAMHRRITKNDEESIWIEALRYLEIGLRPDLDLNEIGRRLKEERDRRPPEKLGAGHVRDYPVHLIDGSTLRLTWRSSSSSIVPPIQRVLDAVSRQIPIHATTMSVTDTTKPLKDQAKMESQILELAQEGRIIDAVKLTRKRYSCSLAEAKAFVEGLTSDGTADRSRVRLSGSVTPAPEDNNRSAQADPTR